MSSFDPRVDAYIEKSTDFAKPILSHIRECIHSTCAEVEETMKWGFPHFMYKGILCSMAAFKHHCALGFWKGALVFDSVPEARKKGKETAMGQLGRLKTIADLPGRTIFIRCVIEAVRLNETGVKVPAKPKPPKKALVVPADLMASLKANKKAFATFKSLSYSHRKDYVQWITAAKTEETRLKRLKTAIEWMTQRKSRHWKYENC